MTLSDLTESKKKKVSKYIHSKEMFLTRPIPAKIDLPALEMTR